MLAQIIELTASLRPLLWMLVALLVLSSIAVLAAHHGKAHGDGGVHP
ncbi:MAG TPA: hypothetical protein VL403_16865 [Candidatus Kryptonia bacterium]|nr:hypothetical protein [Candidatus Kryptonia bacterium]